MKSTDMVAGMEIEATRHGSGRRGILLDTILWHRFDNGDATRGKRPYPSSRIDEGYPCLVEVPDYGHGAGATCVEAWFVRAQGIRPWGEVLAEREHKAAAQARTDAERTANCAAMRERASRLPLTEGQLRTISTPERPFYTLPSGRLTLSIDDLEAFAQRVREEVEDDPLGFLAEARVETVVLPAEER